MPIRTESIDINGVTIEVTQLPYFKAQRLFTKLVKLLGPGLLGLATLAGGGNAGAALGALLNLKVEQLQPLLADLFAQLEPDTVEQLVKDALSTAQAKQGDKLVMLLPVIDAVLPGEFWGVLVLFLFALRVHFGNFSTARDAFAQLGLTAPASPSAG